jgi:hypothetical protein
MNNRMGLALAVGGGYVLGRTKKAKLALGLGSLVLGKKLNLTPAALGEYLTAQLRENPQLKEIGTELRKDLGGVGKAATGALATRQLNSLADHLHSRTAGLQDQLGGALPGRGGRDGARNAGDAGDAGHGDDDRAAAGRDDSTGEGRGERRPARRTAAKTAAKTAGTARTAGKTAGTAGRTAGKTVTQAGGKAPAKKAPAKRASAGKTAAKAPARKTGTRAEPGARRPARRGSAEGGANRD